MVYDEFTVFYASDLPKVLGMSRKQTDALLQSGEIPYTIALNGKKLIWREDVDAYRARQRRKK